MRRGLRIGLGAAALGALGLGWLLTSGPPPPTPNPPGTFSFAALGDAPYNTWEDLQYRLVLRELEDHDLAFVLHVGDVFWHPCNDARYRRSLAAFQHLPHPVVYTPGDNEWTDCWEPGSGGFEPLERLERIRSLFFGDPAHSLGATQLSLVSQGAGASFAEFVENARWTWEGLVFATVHLVGSDQGRRPFPGRSAADDAAAERRLAAATAWLRETFGAARAVNASAVVLAFHADPAFGAPVGSPERAAFEPFLLALEEEVEAFPGPVLAVHGDEHAYTVDHPLVRRTTGRRLERFTRLEVPGSPRVGWVRVVVTPGAIPSFAFQEHVVPRWKCW